MATQSIILTDTRCTIIPDITTVTGLGIVTGEWSTGRPDTTGIIHAATIIVGAKLASGSAFAGLQRLRLACQLDEARAITGRIRTFPFQGPFDHRSNRPFPFMG